MLKSQKAVFIALCIVLLLINGAQHSVHSDILSFLGVAIGSSIVSIPVWCVIGVVLSNIGVFFYRLAKPEKDPLTMLQKAGLGLIVAIIIKIFYGSSFFI
jgi:hypothetical protein